MSPTPTVHPDPTVHPHPTPTTATDAMRRPHDDHDVRIGRTRRIADAAAVGYAGFAAMQLAVAAGAPIADHVWGGRGGDLSDTALRVASVGAAVALLSAAAVVRARARTGTSRRRRSAVAVATWATAGYMALNTLGNLASPSAIERFAFAPATATLAVLTAWVARSAGAIERGSDDRA